jgi:hypothetical protein
VWGSVRGARPLRAPWLRPYKQFAWPWGPAPPSPLLCPIAPALKPERRALHLCPAALTSEHPATVPAPERRATTSCAPKCPAITHRCRHVVRAKAPPHRAWGSGAEAYAAPWGRGCHRASGSRVPPRRAPPRKGAA